MKTEKAKEILSGLIAAAKRADAHGDATNRQQFLRTIEDLPLPVAYVTTALEPTGLLAVYQGPVSE